MEINNKRNSYSLNFYSNDMIISKEQINHNYLKLIYQRISLADLEKKHKEWTKK